MNDSTVTDKEEERRIKHNKKNSNYYHKNHDKMKEYQRQKQREYYLQNRERKLEKTREYQQRVKAILQMYKEEKNVSSLRELLGENVKN